MQKSKKIGKLVLALSKVQAQLGKNPIVVLSNNRIEQELQDLWSSTRDLLAQNELVVIQMPTDIAGLTTVLAHSSGEYFASTCYIPAKEDAEDVKHAVNYARTIALASFIGLVVD